MLPLHDNREPVIFEPLHIACLEEEIGLKWLYEVTLLLSLLRPSQFNPSINPKEGIEKPSGFQVQ